MKKLFFLVMAVMFGLTTSMNANAATTSAMTTSSVAAASSSSDWDKVLDSYEKYVNEYIAVYKKVQAGDASAYSQHLSWHACRRSMPNSPKPSSSRAIISIYSSIL